MSSSSSEQFTIPKSAVRRIGTAVAGVIVVIVLILLVLALAPLLAQRDSLAAAINHREYQAVFLTNGQVYFGKLAAPGGDFYDLRDVFYLQSQASPQSPRVSQLSIQKLTNAVHSPEDLMAIARSQILFVENLRLSGKFSRYIQAHSGP